MSKGNEDMKQVAPTKAKCHKMFGKIFSKQEGRNYIFVLNIDLQNGGGRVRCNKKCPY